MSEYIAAIERSAYFGDRGQLHDPFKILMISRYGVAGEHRQIIDARPSLETARGRAQELAATLDDQDRARRTHFVVELRGERVG